MSKDWTIHFPCTKFSCRAYQLGLLSSAGREMSSSLRATRWRPSLADWGSGMSPSCKLRVQIFADAGNGWPHSVLRYIISSCQSAATSEIVKRFWSRVWLKKRYSKYVPDRTMWISSKTKAEANSKPWVRSASVCYHCSVYWLTDSRQIVNTAQLMDNSETVNNALYV